MRGRAGMKRGAAGRIGAPLEAPSGDREALA
jgi:hypothetical protein